MVLPHRRRRDRFAATAVGDFWFDRRKNQTVARGTIKTSSVTSSIGGAETRNDATPGVCGKHHASRYLNANYAHRVILIYDLRR